MLFGGAFWNSYAGGETKKQWFCRKGESPTKETALVWDGTTLVSLGEVTRKVGDFE